MCNKTKRADKMKTLNKALSLIGLVACSAVAQDIKIESSYLGITEPNKPRVVVDVPIVLTPASDFNLEYKTNRVEITRKFTTNTWTFVSPAQTRRFAVESLQSQYEKAISQVILLEDHASFYGQKLDRSAFKSLYRSWGQPECTWTTERATNWIGLQNQWRQVGIITEETKLKVMYNGQTNVFTWESKELGTTGPRNYVFQTNTVSNFTWYNYNGSTN